MTENMTIDNKPQNPIRTWLFNPFYYLGGSHALLAGVGILILSCLFAMLTDTHFDGVLDFHPGVALPVWTYWIESPVDWLIMGLLLLIGGKLLSKSKVRIVDVFGAQALARFPALLMVLIQLPPSIQKVNQQLVKTVSSTPVANMNHNKFMDDILSTIHPFELLLYAVMLGMTLIMLIWMIYLMYKAFAVSCNLHGGKAIILFIGLLILGEVISKLFLVLIFTSAGL